MPDMSPQATAREGGSQGTWRMKTVRMLAADYADFLRQAQEVREAHPGSLGLSDEHLKSIWNAALQFQRPGASETVVNLFFYLP